MKVRWNFRCYPTPEQEVELAKTFGCVRYVYNWALDARTKAFKDGKRLGYAETDRNLTALKKQPGTEWLADVSSVALQQSLRDLQTAFSNFFAKTSRYPSFKKKTSRQSARYTANAFRYDASTSRLSVAKIGQLKVKWSRRLPVQPSSVTIIRNPSGRYFISCVIDIQPAPLPETGKSVGVDFGISRLATLSTGEMIANPRHIRKHERRLKAAQKSLSRKKKGSNRRRKAVIRVARIHEKIANSRKDTQNKLAWSLVTRFDDIFVEDLNLRGMAKNHSLARSLSDAAIGSCIQAIESKAAMHGKRVFRVDRWFPSSKMCSSCGAVRSKLPLSVRQWECDCGAKHDRDINAALNILSVGQTEHGVGVRATGFSDSGPSGDEVRTNC